MHAKYSFLFLLSIVSSISAAQQREMTINVEPRRQDCFFEPVKQGDTIEIDYQVIDGGHGELDITFNLAEPTGRIIHTDIKKPENNFRITATSDGDYKFCFDNSFSSYNVKTIFFELIITRLNENPYDDFNFDGVTEGNYEISIENIHEVVNTVRRHVTEVRHLQELMKSTEARDRNIAEENFFKVNTFSMIQIIIMGIVGFIQVVMVKSLFDEKSKIHNIWKHLNR